MTKYKLKNAYFIILYLLVMLLSVVLFLCIKFILLNDRYYFLYFIPFIIILLSLKQRKAYVSIKKEEIIRYAGFRSFGYIVIKFSDVDKVQYKNGKILISDRKGNFVLEINKYFKNFKEIGRNIYLNMKEIGLNEVCGVCFKSYFFENE